MLVLHAHFQPPSDAHPGGLILWAEDGARRPLAPPRVPTPKRPEPHPFAAAPDKLRRALSEATLAPQNLAAHGEPTAVFLWLPTHGRLPEASPHLVVDCFDEKEDAPGLAGEAHHGAEQRGEHGGQQASRGPRPAVTDAEEGGSPVELRLWQIPGLRWELPAAIRFLTTLDPSSLAGGQVRLADDIQYWQAASRLLLETMAAQKVLPGLVAEPGGKGYQARWLPVLDDAATGPRLTRLAAAMPGLCRAGAAAPEDGPGPTTLLEQFLVVSTDALARAWLPAPLAASGGDVASRWLAALGSTDGAVKAGASALGHLHQGHRKWLEQLFVAGDRTYRVALRLEEPARDVGRRGGELTQGSGSLPDGGPAATGWRLHFFLQAQDDPSLLVPAAEVWRAHGDVLSVLGRRFGQPRERLLGALGYAARLSPPIRRALRSKKPQGASLSTQEAHEFLRQAAPVLELAGFGLIVPPWWQRPGGRLGLRLKIGSKSGPQGGLESGLGLDALVNFHWRLALGDEALSREELEALVMLKAPLVELRGQWVELDPAQVEAAIRFWERSEFGEMSLAQALQLQAGLDTPEAALPLDAVDYDGALEAFLGRLTGETPLVPVAAPKGLKAKLRPYQAHGLAWLEFLRQAGLGGILADDMGLGKTVQLLSLLLHAKTSKGGLPGPILLVAPTSVVTNWAREAARFTPALRLRVHQGADRLQGEAFAAMATSTDIVVTSYALLRRDEKSLADVSWYGVVLDEAQQIKNPDARQAQVVRALPAEMRFALTGTPVENRLSELWSIMQFLAPGYLGSQAAFRRRLALPIERHGDHVALGALRQLTAPFILRRLKTDPTVIQDLPEKREVTEYAVLTPEQVTLYEAQVRAAMADVGAAGEGIERKGLVLRMLLRLKQICNHPLQFLGQVRAGEHGPEAIARSGKLARSVEILEEVVAAGDRALVFTQFAEMGELLRATFQASLGVPVLFLHGGVAPTRRDELVRRFQEDADGPPIFVLSLKAGGTGLNLTRASHVVHFDRWWNPAVENQATDRAFRIGQTKNVLVHKFVCAGTLEEKIDALIERKQALARSVVGDGEGWLTELTNDDLAELVTLRRDALGM